MVLYFYHHHYYYHCYYYYYYYFFSVALRPNADHGLLILEVFLDHTQRRTTVGRTPLGEWSARRRDVYLTTHNTHNRQISMPLVGFEPTISAGERPQTYASDRMATGTGTTTTTTTTTTSTTTTSTNNNNNNVIIQLIIKPQLLL
jgi:hypothetical protein